MQLGPDLLLGPARLGVLVHSRQARLADANGPAHHLDLVRALDGARLLGKLLALDIDIAGLFQRPQPQRLDLVDGDPLVAAAVPAQELDDLAAPGLDLALDVLGRRHVDPGDAGPDLVDARQTAAEMLAAVELEQDRRPLGEDERIAIGIVQRPELHVRGVEGIADIDGVVEQGRRAVVQLKLLAQTGQAIAPRGIR